MSILRGIMAGGMALAMSPAHAQHWESAGIPEYLYMPSPYICYTDTTHDALYVGGGCFLNGSNIVQYLLYRYQEGVWDSIGSFGNSIRTAIVYHDTLIVGGGFHTVDNQAIERIACYAGGNWQPYGTITDVQGAGDVSRLRVIDGDLYALGTFDTADGYFCNGLAKRVGGHWENVGDLSFLHPDAWMMDLAKYQGKLVLTGNFTSPDYTMNDLLQFDGNSWDWVCSCLNGGFDGGGSLAVYQGSLYLGGIFYYGSGNVGQGLMRWDGEQWYIVGQSGGGLQLYNNSDAYSPTINGFLIKDGLLLVGGAFSFADHLPASCIASWNGNQWCSLGGTLDGEITAMTFYHDSLYVGFGPGHNADGQSANGVARFIGSSYQENCAATGIEEIGRTNIQGNLQTVGTASGFSLWGLTDGQHEVRIYDSLGRLVKQTEVYSNARRSGTLSLVEQGSAMYIIVVDEAQTTKFIPLH